MNLYGLFAPQERKQSDCCRLSLEWLEPRLLLDGAIDVELAPVPSPSGAGTAPAVPVGISEVGVGATFYLEAWIRNADGSPNGITGGYVDISFDASLLTCESVSNGGAYTVLSSGAIDNLSGLVDDLGGNAEPGVVDLGDDEWVRLGYVEFTAQAVGAVEFTTSPGIDRFARAGEGGIDWQDVELNDPPVTFTVESFAVIEEHTYDDGFVMTVYDIDPSNGVPSSDIVAWSCGEFRWGETELVVDAGYVGDRIISLIMLFGDGTDTADLGVEVTGNAGLASLIDARTNPEPLGFLASDGYVGTVSLGAGITGAVLDAGQEPTAIYSGDYVQTVIAKGDVDGNLVAGGDLTLLQVLGGDLNGDVTLTGSNLGTVMAIGGGISGSIQAPTGSVGTVMAINGAITSPTIYGQTGVNLVQAIGGGVASSIASGASLGTVMAINGNLDVSGGRSISAGGTINALMAINGNIIGDGLGSPDISVGNGNLSSLLAVGGGMQSVWVDVNGSGASSGRLSSVYVGESVTNSLFEADGLLSSLFSLGDFTNSSVQAGSLSVVYMGGTISEDSSDEDTDAIHADTGSYFVIDSTKFAQITPTVSESFAGVTASAG